MLFHHFSVFYRIVCLLHYFYLANDSLSYQVAMTAAMTRNYILSNTIMQPLVIGPEMRKNHILHLHTLNRYE